MEPSLTKLLEEVRVDVSDLEKARADSTAQAPRPLGRRPRATPPPLPPRLRAATAPVPHGLVAPGLTTPAEGSSVGPAPTSTAVVALDGDAGELVAALELDAEEAAPVEQVIDQASKVETRRRDQAEFDATLSAVSGTVDLSMFRTPGVSLSESLRRERRRRVALAGAVLLGLATVAAGSAIAVRMFASAAPTPTAAPLAAAPVAPAPVVAQPLVPEVVAIEAASVAAATAEVAPAIALVEETFAPDSMTDPVTTRRPVAVAVAAPTAIESVDQAAAYTGPSGTCDEVACLTEGKLCCPKPGAEATTPTPVAAPVTPVATEDADTDVAATSDAEPDALEPAAEPVEEVLPERPSRSDLMRGLKSAQAKLVHCAEAAGQRGTITFDVAVGAFGALDSVASSPSSGELDACASRAIGKVAFPASRAGARISFPIIVR